MLSLLPDDLVFDLLENWLEVTLLARLDSAYCVHSLRKDFLNQLETRVVSCTDIVNAPLINWMTKRNVRTNKIIQNKVRVAPATDSQLKFIQRLANEVRCVELATMSHSETILSLISRNYSQLNVFRCVWISPSDLFEVLLRNPYLQNLDCRMKRGWTDSLRTCSLPHLTSLRITVDDECDARVMPALIEATSNLQRLTVEGGFDSLPNTAHIKACCSGIRSFNLRFAQHSLNASVISIVNYCPNILNIDFGSNSSLLDSHVLLVAQNLVHLRAISLRGCRDISDESLVHLQTYCAQRLEYIQLGTNPHITRAGMDIFRRACKPSLKFQDLEFGWADKVARITSEQKETHLVLLSYVPVDRILHDSADQCVSIETLIMCGNKRVCPLSPKGLSELCVKWPRLHTVVLDDGGGNARQVAEIGEYVPNVRVTLDGEFNEFDVMKMSI